MDTIRILIADDQRLVREGIASLLDIQEDIEVVGTAVDGAEAVQMAMAVSPDVILMDIRMPHKDGVEATREIAEKLPDIKVLMLTTFDDEEFIIQSMRAGASGYLLKDMPAEDLAQAIRMTRAGISSFAPSVTEKLINQLRKTPSTDGDKTPKPITHKITDREMDVLRLIATGATNKEIADELAVSEGTVKNHVSNILSRLGLRDRIQAALFAYEHGLI
ncbi:MAG: response regulator transcription factor [Anaerolineales bacterium]|nr:response regulator transcription factor [Anaerolineales bacterium]